MARSYLPERAEGLKLLAEGGTVSAVARQLGMSRSTVASWKNDQRHKPAVPKEAISEMRVASQRQQVRVQAAYQAQPEHSPEARWKAAELDNAEHIKKSLLMAKFSVELPDEPCAITFLSDQHISIGNTVDLARMREDAELVAATDGCFAILGGDATDNHIKHRAAVLAARSQPSDQYELFEYYLSIFSHRVLVAISGNHDLWTNQIAGVDVLSMLLNKHSVCYAPDEAILTVQVGQQPYEIAIRHQYRYNSSFNDTHCVKQMFRLGERQWDIGCIGHNHVAAIESFMAHGLERWAARPGSYQITSAFTRQYGYNKSRPTCPTFVLSPHEREIVGFHDLRPALRFLKGERK